MVASNCRVDHSKDSTILWACTVVVARIAFEAFQCKAGLAAQRVSRASPVIVVAETGLRPVD